MHPFWSWLLTAVGVTGLYLAGRKSKAGWVVGFGAQALWIAYAIATRQWGFIASAVAYGAVYARNWLRWRRDARGQGLQLTAEQIAIVCHEANRALQRVTADPVPSPPWDEAPGWQRESAVDGVRNILDGTVISSEQSHESWCAHRRAAGWTYGETKDAEAKTHPCLVPYAELPAEERAKDSLFGAVVAALRA